MKRGLKGVLDNVRHENWNILFIEVTGNTHSLNISYVHETAKQLGIEEKLLHRKREDLDFFDCMRRWGVPVLGFYRWCLHQFKRKLIEKHAEKIVLSGEKRSDSVVRRKVDLATYFRTTEKISVHPIAFWTTEQVRKRIKEHGLEICPCYSIFGHSGNCMFCPYHNKREIIRTLQDSEWRERILSALACTRGEGRVRREILEKWISCSRITALQVT